MNPITTFEGQVVQLVRDNIDTDQIIPARFLKVTSRTGLGEHLFADWRASDPTFPLNLPEGKGRGILLAGNNFGCGSSREHAPWALSAWGFRAIVALSFADIFRNNALKNGLLPVALSGPMHASLRAQLERDPLARLTVDLASATLILPDGKKAPFPIDPFAQKMLIEGKDELGYLLGLVDRIDAYEHQRAAKAP